jgi:GNAT superfamily N-acetyltransferase
MTLSVRTMETRHDMLQFVKFPWQIYRNDPYWVPPLVTDTLDKLDPAKNQFWKTASRQCWLTFRDGKPVGRICAIADAQTAKYVDAVTGKFGFFECENDPEVAALLFSTAGAWLAERGFTRMRGPYNPSTSDEVGIMVEGFDIRPVLLTGHTPPYYIDLFKAVDLHPFNDTVARLYRPPAGGTFDSLVHPKLVKAAQIAEKRRDVTIRQLNLKNWESDIRLACDITNRALGPLPEYIPMPQDEFLDFANGFRPIIDPKMALVAEVDGKPVGYALAFPDVNQALQKANGYMNFLGTIRFLLEMRRIERVSFKILMILPEYQGRGIEVLLIKQIGNEILKRGFKEVDMSLAGDENIKSNRFQDNLGFKVYLRYRIYEKRIDPHHDRQPGQSSI